MLNNDSRDDSLEGLLQELADSLLRRMECSLPCVVTRVSSDRRRVSVRPLVRMVDRSGDTISREVIEGITVYQAGAGDMLISFPVKVGDIGWIEASDRDLGIFLQSYTESNPGSRRKHSFSDAKFVPDIMTNFEIAIEDADAIVIQNRTGTVKIALDADQVRIVNGTSRVDINASTVVINGATVTASGDFVTASGVSLAGHQHNQPNDSGGNIESPTAPPTPTEV